MKDAGIVIQAHELSDLGEEDHKYPGSWGPASFFERLYEVWEAAMDCLGRNVAEPRWNAEVHSRLLYLALRGQWKTKGIWYEDITTARISDKDLLAKIGGRSISSKLVDYAIMIDPDYKLKRRIAQAARASTQSPAWSINCIAAEYIQLNPIAISIETKRETASNGDPYQQLGIWASAHFLKLHQLTDPLTKLPAMPLLSVDRHRWRLIIAVWHAEPNRNRLEILSTLPLGETATLPGVYRVVAAIRRLARWGNDKYRTWFEEKILESR